MTLDSIIQNLDLYLADEIIDPIGYLETLLLNLKELRDEQLVAPGALFTAAGTPVAWVQPDGTTRIIEAGDLRAFMNYTTQAPGGAS